MSRLSKLRSKMLEMSWDSVIIFGELNQRYLTNFAFTDGLLLISQNDAFLLTDFRYYEAALLRANKEFTVVEPAARSKFVSDFFSNTDSKKVAFDGDSVNYSTYEKYRNEYVNITFESLGDTLDLMRMVKSEDEIQKLQLAQDITDKAFSQVLVMIDPEMTEIEVALELEYAMRKNGAESFSFETVAVSGDASAVPHGTPRNIKLQRGFLTMDFGAKYDGYCADMTRTVVIGKADEEMKKLYNTVLRAQRAALDFLREGVDCGEADRVARDIIDAEPEFVGTFGHSLGHSIGLNVHEMPGLSKRFFGTKLQCGQITSVEPGIYLFGKYGCRIEDMVAIEKNGVHNFTHSPKDLLEIY